MTDISRRALFGKLNPLAYKAVEGATVFCKLRGNPKVELQHWLYQILNTQDSDLHRLVRHYGLDAAQLSRDMIAALDRLPGGANAVTDLSIFVENAVERGWVYATLLLGEMQVRSGHVLLACSRPRGCGRRCWRCRASSTASRPTIWPGASTRCWPARPRPRCAPATARWLAPSVTRAPPLARPAAPCPPRHWASRRP